MPKKTFELAEKAKAILVTQVKANQKILYKQIVHGCKLQKASHMFKDPIDKAHGRIEQRVYEYFNADPMLRKFKDEWPFIRGIIKVTRIRGDLSKPGSPSSKTEAYYVTNNKPTQVSPREIKESIRRHWWIENKNHYVKDVAFKEDAGKTRVNPFVFAFCVDASLNIMRAYGVNNIKERLTNNSFSLKNTIHHLKKYLF